jgi:FkbM family methyltransferase
MIDVSTQERVFKLGNAAVSVRYRLPPATDHLVLKEVFVQHAYGFGEFAQGRALGNYCSFLQARGSTPFLCDAGANIGAVSLYYCRWFPSLALLAIEPDPNNLILLKRNLEGRPNTQIFAGALMGSLNPAYLNSRAEWSHRVSVTDDGQEISVITPNEIVEALTQNDHVPFIMKMDIEGAESDVFSGDAGWVDRFPLVVIELHDWMLPFSGSSRDIFKSFGRFDFDVVIKNQLCFFFNNRILRQFRD